MNVVTLDQIDHEIYSGFRWLRFSKPIESRYLAEYARSRVKLAALWAVVGTLIYDLVYFGDMTMMGDVFKELAFVRFAIFTPYAVIAVLLVRRWPSALSYDALAVSVAVLGGFLPMAVAVHSHSPYYFAYQTGDIMTLLFFVILLQPRFPAILFGLTMLCGMHFALMQANGSLDAVTASGVVTFFITVSLFLVLSAYFMERKDRMNFLNRIRGQLLQDELRRQSEQDELTGLQNRRSLARISDAIWSNAEGHKSVALIMLDIDHFKLFNDVHGHIEGDSCIRAVSDCVMAELGEMGAAFRFGGEELLVLLPSADKALATRLAENIRCAIEARAIAHRGLSAGSVVTASLGVTCGHPAVWSLEALLKAADQALYDAKDKGRNAISVTLLRQAADAGETASRIYGLAS